MESTAWQLQYCERELSGNKPSVVSSVQSCNPHTAETATEPSTEKCILRLKHDPLYVSFSPPRDHSYGTFALKGEGGLGLKQGGGVDLQIARGEGSNNPKILRTSFMDAPLGHAENAISNRWTFVLSIGSRSVRARRGQRRQKSGRHSSQRSDSPPATATCGTREAPICH